MKKNYIYLNDIFSIKLEHMQLITTLIITYAMIFDKTNKARKCIYNIHIQIIKYKCVNT